jgi:hypothetical protein
MREIDLGFYLVGRGVRHAPGFGCPSCLCRTTEMAAHLLRFMFFKRARMGLLLRDACLGQHIQNGFAFDFQLSGQIVDSNLAHPPLSSSAPHAKSASEPRVNFLCFFLSWLLAAVIDALAIVSTSP